MTKAMADWHGSWNRRPAASTEPLWPRRSFSLAGALLAGRCFMRGVLPEDRADVLYHRYDGGGVTIHGPSVLVRKKMAEKYAVSANYYMDMVTSASIDVEVSGASEYKEERDQYSLGFEYLRGKTTYNLELHQQRRERLPGRDHRRSASARTCSAT